MNTNIEYWEKVLGAPTPAYKDLFIAERDYLLKYIKPGMKVLDIGCGDGRNINTVSERTKFITGIDNDKTAVQGALKNFSDVPTINIICAEAARLPFTEESFDIVTFLMILPNLDKQKIKSLSEASRVLKPDGIIILSTFAETAFEERMKMYKALNAPIDRIDGTKVIFDKKLGANISEQFSISEINDLAKVAGLKVANLKKVGVLAYICTLAKITK